MSTKCKGCGRKLKSAESIERGYGLKCFKEATEDQQSAHRQFTDRVNGTVSAISMQPVAAYIVSNEEIISLVTDKKYFSFRQRHPEDKIEARVYIDFITYQAERSENRRIAVEMAHDAELFVRMKNTLREPREGVVPISIQQEMGLAV